MRKAQEEELKKKKKNQVRTAFVSKKARKSIKEESEEDRPISDSSHESANYQQQMSMIDLTGYTVPDEAVEDIMKKTNESYEDSLVDAADGPKESDMNQLDVEHGVFRRGSTKKTLDLKSKASKLASQLSLTN